MRPLRSSVWHFAGRLCLCALLISPHIFHTVTSYPEPPDALGCSRTLGRPLSHWACQVALDNLPRGSLPSVFTTRAHTRTNNYIQVPVRNAGVEPRPDCVVTIDLDGDSVNDQFIVVPWDEIRKMTQRIVDTCVKLLGGGGFITYGVGRTLETLIANGENNDDNPTPTWVRQPDDTVEYVAIPLVSAVGRHSKFNYFALDAQPASYKHFFAL